MLNDPSRFYGPNVNKEGSYFLVDMQVQYGYQVRMPRQGHIDTPGALHHIIIRGIERRVILDDDKAREGGWTVPQCVRSLHMARALIGLIAVRDLWISGSEVARRLNIDRSAICLAVKRAEEDEELIAAGGAVWELLQTEINQY